MKIFVFSLFFILDKEMNDYFSKNFTLYYEVKIMSIIKAEIDIGIFFNFLLISIVEKDVN